MIDAERMLGSLVRNAMQGGRGRRRRRRRRSSLPGLGKSGLALGALGVAIATFEHLTQKKPAAPTSGEPPLPPLPVTPDNATPLPPLPRLPTPPAVAAPPGDQQEAILLVRAMIAAANADGEVDADERRRILDSLAESGVSAEERQYLSAELESPIDGATLAAEARSPELARQVYLASLMAIEVDSEAERAYLASLARGLGLDERQVEELTALVDAEPAP